MKTILSLEKEMTRVKNILDRFTTQKEFFTKKCHTDYAIALTKGLSGFKDYHDLLKTARDAFRIEAGFKEIPIRVKHHLTLVVNNERR